MKPVRALIALFFLIILLVSYGIGTCALISESVNGNREAVFTTISALARNEMTDYMPFVRTSLHYLVQAAVQKGATPPSYFSYYEDSSGLAFYDYHGELESDIASRNVILYGQAEHIQSRPTSETHPYGILWSDGELTVWSDDLGQKADYAGYFFKSYCYQYDLEAWFSSEVGENTIGILIAKEPIKLSNTSSYIYHIYSEFRLMRLILLALAAGVLLILFLGIYLLLNRRSISYVMHRIAALLRHVFLELKIVCGIFVAAFAIILIDSSSSDHYFTFVAIGSCFSLVLILLLSDLAYNRSQFFKNNFPNRAFKAVKKLIALKPFGRAELFAYILFAVLEGLLGFFALLSLVNAFTNDDTALFFVLFFLCGMIATAVGFGIHLYEKNREMEQLLARIDCMKRGEAAPPCDLPETSHVHPAMDALDHIYAHVKSATEQSLKSERMKLELITKVSHDLKTPLTSIISYVDLLSKENDLSPTARDYVNVLEKKSQRLKQLIGDLFDLSKAASSDIAYHPEPLDLVRLVNQVQAELSDKIENSDLHFICRAPAEPQIITSDGALLRRVIENLTLNALKYAMPNSRVYIDIMPEETSVSYTIKNISREELHCTPDELIARFVRGDNSRTTEGSGLGLSIAQSYTEVCGGSFNLTLDGDLFKVTLTFTKSGTLDLPTSLATSEDTSEETSESSTL